jgi:hypothetical protein
MRADNIPARTSEWATAEYRAVIATLASARLETFENAARL